jgi:hypothetical protein
MVVKWAESERFRSRTRQRLVAQVESVQPDAILAHSLGSLVAYDAHTHPDTRDRLSGTVLVTLGSQIANPFVSGQFLGGRISVPESASHWYHLFNERDMVFTEPIRLSDERSLKSILPSTPTDPPTTPPRNISSTRPRRACSGAHFGHREHAFRSIVNSRIGIVNTHFGHREHGRGADGVRALFWLSSFYCL